MGWLLCLKCVILQGLEEQKRDRSEPLCGILRSSQCPQVKGRGRVEELQKSKRRTKCSWKAEQEHMRGTEDVQQRYMRWTKEVQQRPYTEPRIHNTDFTRWSHFTVVNLGAWWSKGHQPRSFFSRNDRWGIPKKFFILPDVSVMNSSHSCMSWSFSFRYLKRLDKPWG